VAVGDFDGDGILDLAVGLVVGWAGQAKAEPSYAHTTIDVPGSSSTIAYGINDSGQIVREYRDTACGRIQTVLECHLRRTQGLTHASCNSASFLDSRHPAGPASVR
jgi:hypothetical protein